MPVSRPGASRPVSPHHQPAGDTGSEIPSRPTAGRTRPPVTGELAQLRRLDRSSNPRQFTESSDAGSSRLAPSTPFRPGATPPRSPFGGRRVEQGGTSASPLRSPMRQGPHADQAMPVPSSREHDRLRQMTEVAFPYESVTLVMLRSKGMRPEACHFEVLQRQEQTLRETLNTPHGDLLTIDRGPDGQQLRLVANHIELSTLLERNTRGVMTPSEALRSATSNILSHAERYFRALAANPPQPLPPMTPPPTHHSANIMKAMLREAPGIVIGEAHSSISSKRVLVKHMGELKKAGVKTLFMEHLCADVHGPALAQYLASPPGSPMPQRLATYLDLLDHGHMSSGIGRRLPEANKYNFTTLIQAAQRTGINIVPVDTVATYILSDEKNPLGRPGDRERARTEAMNFLAAEKIRLLAGDGKWVAFVGNSHASTYRGTPGLAQLTGTRSMFIDDNGNSTKASVAVNVRDYRNRGVLSPDIVLSYKK